MYICDIYKHIYDMKIKAIMRGEKGQKGSRKGKQERIMIYV